MFIQDPFYAFKGFEVVKVNESFPVISLINLHFHQNQTLVSNQFLRFEKDANVNM